jgi:hypothetical protein
LIHKIITVTLVILHKTDSETTSERLLWGVHSETCQIFEGSQISAQLLENRPAANFPWADFFWVQVGAVCWRSGSQKFGDLLNLLECGDLSLQKWVISFMDIHLLIMLILAEVVELGLGSPPRIDATWAWVPFWGSNGSREVVIVILFAKMEGFIHFKPCPQCRRPINLRREQSVSRSNTSRRWKVLLRRALTQSSFPKFQ